MTMLKDTIISAFNYDGTLLKWLKKVEEALQNASASEFRVNKKGNSTISFSIVFANGDTLESGDIILQQGESVTGATIRQGHLILTLSNGDELDAGDVGAVTGFSINTNQHLIVSYQNGTTQDLGAIFSGNVNINGNLTANSIIENMSGYSFTSTPSEFENFNTIYSGVVKNGNKLTFVLFASFQKKYSGVRTLAQFAIPSTIANKLIPTEIIASYPTLDLRTLSLFDGTNVKTCIGSVYKKPNNRIDFNLDSTPLELDTTYYVRYEATFLLSENLAS